MLAFGVMSVLLSVSIIGVSLLLIGLVLLQKNRGAGLSGAFGGVGGHSAFGTKTGDFLTWITVALVAVFLLLTVVANFAFEPESLKKSSTLDTDFSDTTTIPLDVPLNAESSDGTPQQPPVSGSQAPAQPRLAPTVPEVPASTGDVTPEGATPGTTTPGTTTPGSTTPEGTTEEPPASN